MSFYGIETWFLKLYDKDLKRISVPYHRAIKRIYGRTDYDSNHDCLDNAKLPIFKHLQAKKMISYAYRLFASKSPCVATHKYYLRHESVFSKQITKYFLERYQVDNIFDNPLCAILSRIEFVQRTEPRSLGYDPG